MEMSATLSTCIYIQYSVFLTIVMFSSKHYKLTVKTLVKKCMFIVILFSQVNQFLLYIISKYNIILIKTIEIKLIVKSIYI